MARVPLLLALICASQVANAQSYLPATELVLQAISQQAEVLAADERVNAVNAEARALAIGSYGLEVTLAPQRRRTEYGESFDEFQVELGRQVRLPGKAPLDREIGARARAVAALQRNEVAHDAAQRLLALWMEWLRATANEEQAKAQLQLLETEHASLQRRMETGDAARLELDLIAAELAQARATALRSETLAVAARHTLNTDFPQIPLPAVAPTLPDPTPLPGTSGEWQARIVEDSYELEAVEHEAARRDAVAQRANADRVPDPTLGIRLFDERAGEERGVGVVFAMPLASRHRRELADAERAHARASQREVEAVRRSLVRDAHLKVVLSADALAQWRAQREAYEAMQAAADRTHRAWELGEVDLSERLLATRRARELAYQELAARAEAHEAKLRVRIDSHDLWHPDTAESNP